jgi:hypothetical protein
MRAPFTLDDAFAGMVKDLDKGLTDEIETELRRGADLEIAHAFQRQIRAAKFNRDNPRRAIDGIGAVTMSIDPVLRMWAERKYGRGCFKDKNFVRELLRDNPFLKVPYARKAMVSAPGRIIADC